MKTRILSGLVGVSLTMPAAAMADVCKDIEAGGTVKIAKDVSTDGCTATLKKDTIIESDGGRIATGKHGVVIKLNGHSLSMKKVNIDYKGDFAVAVHGDNKPSDKVLIDGVILHDKSGVECKSAASRVGAVLWKTKTATVKMTASDGKVRYGVVVGAPMPKDHKPPAELGTASIVGSIAHCKNSLEANVGSVLAFERAATFNGKIVESVGPCDFKDPTLINLRDIGLPNKF